MNQQEQQMTAPTGFFLNYCGETILDFFILSMVKIYILNMD